MNIPKKRYEKRKSYYAKLLEKQRKSLKLMGNLRLFVALAGLGNIIFLYITKNNNLLLPISLAYIIIFIYLVLKHNQTKHKVNYTFSLYKINNNSLERICGEWKSFSDTGDEFYDEAHNFSADFDIFGKGSLFQWINTAKTYMGRQSLKRYLTETCLDKEQIYKRQEAINELARRLWWRQRFMAEGMSITEEIQNPEILYKWANEKNEFYLKPWTIFGVRILPIISILLILVYFITKDISYYYPIILLALQTLIIKFKNKERSKSLNTVYKYKDNIKVYSKMLKHFENNYFKSEYLKELRDNIINEEAQRAYQQIDRLEKIVENITNRDNAAFIFVNIVTLWDYRCMIALEEWKERSGIMIEAWLDTIGEIEALSSLAVIKYDNPDWVRPEIMDEPSYFKAISMGHPLLTNKRVCNDLEFQDQTRVLLITGSNMSGKSTLLRTAGINLVLAYAGAPVCAKVFKCSIMKIYTCMRISDNLEKNISSFYAELLRIKSIIKATKHKEQIFFLLDEIFKGTNSQDRHEGAKILIRNLLRNGAVGLVSTHDLELGVMEEENKGKIKNYHFQESYKDNEIYFDYKLKPGVSTTRNALYLIRMIGIDDDL
ncbi:MutS family DNA mismatch repair protein [Paramaledivibacter caminithermalis]|jgi:DNA mismatch repair ATPase MutS|uniref:MutS domain III n=1 Tax=Paramaledivibacter caminithermalis (strain DSM 15212 / CIP 107654 / DViRD3) TaxID=1121301 RepID=A0A1M6N1U8_PARC5|nr:MutS family DNA mismatch repair protein [Paramaledivibacter caminithermalis]SHJ89670.1 MutS domain III [Paramaledivibacter caminithermalis DSM 15212]